MDAVLELFDIEIDQEPQTPIGESQIASKLCAMEWRYGFYDLVFHYDRIFDKKIHFERIFKHDPIVSDWLPFLALDLDSGFYQFMPETGLINAFDLSRAEVTMNLHRTPDDLGGKLILKSGRFGQHGGFQACL